MSELITKNFKAVQGKLIAQDEQIFQLMEDVTQLTAKVTLLTQANTELQSKVMALFAMRGSGPTE
jgi:hypothetical protein